MFVDIRGVQSLARQTERSSRGVGQCAPQLCCLLLKLLDGCVDGLVSLQNLVLHCDQWNKIVVVQRLLRREDGIIKVEFSIHVIRRAMIIKHSSHSIPWLLHRRKMSKQRAGESSRRGRIYAKIAESCGLRVASRDSTQQAKIGTTSWALFWFETFRVHLNGLAHILERGSEPDPECRL